MAWTAGTGRSHFAYRAGLVFEDIDGLQVALRGLADSPEGTGEAEPPADPKLAFIYSGEGSQWVGMGETLYQAEPVFRAVLDRCSQVVQQERGASMLDVMFGQPGFAAYLDDPVWARPAIFALEAALTALWRSVGIQPAVVLGQGIGEIAAAQAAGVLSLEDGLRLAGALSGPEAALPRITATPPSLTLISSVTGRVMESPDQLDNSHWRRLVNVGASSQRCIDVLASAGVDTVAEIGPQSTNESILESFMGTSWPAGASPTLINGLVTLGESREGNVGGFVKSVAAAYEAGVSVSFAGLFAGELRRRVAIPIYPFQRRSFWVPNRRTSA